MDEMDGILKLITQFGVIPILITIIIYFYYKVKELNKDLKTRTDELIQLEKDKNAEIRIIEKENVGLLYKSLAALKKITKNNEE